MNGRQLNDTSVGEAAGVSVYVTVSTSSDEPSSSAGGDNAERQIVILDGGTRVQLRSSEGEGSGLLDATYERVRVCISI
jgi:restriction endonuclease Mrr